MTEMQKAIERQIQSYKNLIKTFEREAKTENQEYLREMSKGHAIVLKYIIKDLQVIVDLFGEKEGEDNAVPCDRDKRDD